MTTSPDILVRVSEANIEAVRRIQAAWNRGDLDGMLAGLAPDSEWAIAEANPSARTLRGHDEIRAYLEDWRDTVQGLHYEASRYVDVGDTVVQIGTITGRVGTDGPELTAALALLTRFLDGVAVRTEEYLDVECALAAADVRD